MCRADDRIWQRLDRRLQSTATDPAAHTVNDRPAGRATDRPAREGVSRAWRIVAVAASVASIALAVMIGNYATRIVAIREENSSRLAALEMQERALASQLQDRNRELATLRDQISVSGRLTQAV